MTNVKQGSPMPPWSESAAELMARRFGHQLADRQLPQLVERLRSLTKEFRIAQVEDCLSMLHSLPLDAPLVQRFLETATNKESYFFRDAATMESLRERVLPELIARVSSARSLRVWSAGCSTGEEIYTISILLRELIPSYDDWQIQLVGSDVDEGAIARARAGIYGAWSLRATSEDTRRNYFEERSGPRFALKPRYRRNVVFVRHNLADPESAAPAPGRFDLILCRNVMIYFSPAAQERVAKTMARALAPHGMWLTGSSDPVPRVGFSIAVHPGLLQLRTRTEHDEPSSALEEPAFTRTPDSRAIELPSYVSAAREPTRLSLERAPVSAALESVPEGELPAIRALADAGRTQEALERLDDLAARHVLWHAPYLLRAIVRQAHGDAQGALADLTRVLYLEPAHVEARLRLGLTLAHAGEHERAMAALRTAVSAACEDTSLSELRAVAAQQLVRLSRRARNR
jgi:chemotaxis protein methyltransferase CheR